MPLYKLKPSPGFASTSTRTFGGKTQDTDRTKSFKRSAISAGDGRVSVGALVGDDEDDEDEYIDVRN